ncbi:MAG: phosphodiester glycosidase family protein [Rikenellaceae bacterium]|nr:phosphodiester glycosidase family protein [Rikenellaceae bacterium]
MNYFSVKTLLKAQFISVLALFLMDSGPGNLYGKGNRPIQVVSESPDSVTLVNAQWSNETLGQGLTLRQYHFDNQELFKSNQYISIIEIEAGKGRQVEIVPSPVLIGTSVLAQQHNASAAINGSFFKFNYEHNTIDYNSVDYIRKEGKRLAPNTYTSSNRSMHQKGAIAIYDGELFILYADVLKDWERYIQAHEIITTGPPLRIDGRDLPLENSSFYTTRHPRTAIAKMKNGNILFFTVDGRAASSNGMSLEELQKTLRWLGADYIINLDGGGSTTMYVNGKGVVNHPTDNKLFDNNGERKVANIIIVK